MALDGAKLLLGNNELFKQLFASHSEAAWRDASYRNECIENAALPSEELLFYGKKAVPPIVLAEAERKIQWPDRVSLNEQDCRDFAKKMKDSKNISQELSVLLSEHDQLTIQTVVKYFEASL